jgi:hypothetical protein
MKQSGRRPSGQAWRECARCGFDFPMGLLRRQNGILVCSGPGTSNCADISGYDAEFKRIKLPSREGYYPEPTQNELVE